MAANKKNNANKVKWGIKIYSLNNDNYEFFMKELPAYGITLKFFYDFLNVFSSKTKKVDDTQINLEFRAFIPFNSNIKSKLDNLISTYKNVCPRLNALKKYFGNIQNGEYFCVLPACTEIDTKRELEITKILHELNNKKFTDVNDFFKVVIDNYNIHYYGLTTKKIGHRNKADRICRWCHKTTTSIPPVTFNENAHAISEALGNKNLYLYDECDICNHKYAETIELDFINSVQILNVVWGVKGKRGIPKIKTHNLEIQSLKDVKLDNDIARQDIKKTPLSFNYNAGTITSQNIYRALCKFALSVLEDERVLKNCSWTTDWIRNKYNLKKVPKIYKSLIGGFSSANPIIQLHIRKNQNTEIPLLFAIFNHRDLAYFYIIPANKKEAEYFANDAVLDNFWKILPYSKLSEWKAEDLSNSVNCKITMNLNFIPRENKKT